jgi:hypothetical protein
MESHGIVAEVGQLGEIEMKPYKGTNKYYAKHREAMSAKRLGDEFVPESQAERVWHRRGLIWRTLAIYEGLRQCQIVKLTGLPKHIVEYELGMNYLRKVMPGIRREGKRWHAEGVTEEWLEVLL